MICTGKATELSLKLRISKLPSPKDEFSKPKGQEGGT
jgi:hypothetical protein